MKHYVQLIVTLAFLLVCPSLNAQDKLPIPDDAAQKQASSLIADLYKADYDAAKTPEKRSELAKKMIQTGQESKDDATGRYVLLLTAKDTAAEAGDPSTAMTAAEQIAEHYEVDVLSMNADVLSKVVKALKTPKDHQELATLLKEAIYHALSQDRFDVAKAINSTALDSARQARSPDLVKRSAATAKELDTLELEFQKVQAASKALEASPTDPEANLLIGQYRCFVKGDWENGLLMLALGSNDTLKALATGELAEKPDPLAIGNAWWDYSGAVEVTAKSAARRRAAHWYRQAFPRLEGLSRKVVEARLAEVNKDKQNVGYKAPSKTEQFRQKFASDAVKVNGRYYKVIDKPGITWEDAYKACQEMGGLMACLETQELQKQAFDLKGEKLVWIGAYKHPETKMMIWANGNPFKWFSGTPNDGTYIHMWRKKESGVGSANNKGPSVNGKVVPVDGFICEWEE